MSVPPEKPVKQKPMSPMVNSATSGYGVRLPRKISTIVLGVLSVLPIFLLAGLTLTSFVFFQMNPELLNDYFWVPIVAGFGFAVFQATWLLFFAWYVMRTNRIQQPRKKKWIMLIFTAGMFVIPYLWYTVIWAPSEEEWSV